MTKPFVLLAFKSDRVVLDNDRIWADGSFDSFVINVHKQLCGLFKNSGIEIDSAIVFADKTAFIMARSRSQLGLLEQDLHDAAGWWEMVEAATQRLLKAHDARIPSSEQSIAEAIRRTNAVAWKMAQQGTRMTFLPGTAHARDFIPVDPLLLPRRAEPVQAYTVDIRNREVVGCRCASGTHADLFDDDGLNEIIISLRGDHPEVAVRMAIAEAQELWRGTTTIDATISVIGKGIPRVTGGFRVARR